MSILFLSGLVVGALLCFAVMFFLHKKEVVRLTNEASIRKTDLERAIGEFLRCQEQLGEAKADLKVAEGNVALLKETLDELKSARVKDLEDSRKDYEAKAETLRLAFKEEALKILKQNSKELSDSNSEQMKNIIGPLAKDMESFKKAVDDSSERAGKNTVAIEQQIRAMMEHTEKISRDANNLTEALRSKNKVVGNWGEVLLENALDNMGLVKGSDYELQTTIRDENGNVVKDADSGSRMIPDAAIYLPDNKVIVIDSKVSLKSFTDYTAEENPERKEQHLKDFIASVQTHIRELSAKKYGEHMKQSGKDALSYVIMFIPCEPAFQLFFHECLDKWHSAFDDGIIVTGEANLFAMLKIVQVVWSQYKQQKEIEKIAKFSGELVDRVNRFVKNFIEVGKSLDAAQAKFDGAYRALSGRQSIRTTAGKLEKLGVSVPKFLSGPYDDRLPAQDDDTKFVEGTEDPEKDAPADLIQTGY